ncbi:hypothetical protein Pyrfu_1097 [Pyrolobus fumarii 1A]|uniref:Uncharacterized protein n=1 Tax=Pyrolobus fumarii (strain DSM 11204 / 1A) TaxID=694429 RepID=G0EF68_PYRF1|nr:hypothetical protein [Pyrolobus fumarii]AEM38965.1 hypothetical protein Pyrfu_1097 [Pyrolobus fumarii 1A]
MRIGRVVLTTILAILMLVVTVAYMTHASVTIDVINSYTDIYDISSVMPGVTVAGILDVTGYYLEGRELAWTSGSTLDVYDYIVFVIGPFHEYVAFADIAVNLDFVRPLMYFRELNDDDYLTSYGEHTLYNELLTLWSSDPEIAYQPGEWISSPSEIGFRVFCDRDLSSNTPYCFIITGISPTVILDVPGKHTIFARVVSCLWDKVKTDIAYCAYSTYTFTFYLVQPVWMYREAQFLHIIYQLYNVTRMLEDIASRLDKVESKLGNVASNVELVRDTVLGVSREVTRLGVLVSGEAEETRKFVADVLGRLEQRLSLIVYNATSGVAREVAELRITVDGFSANTSRTLAEIQARLGAVIEALSEHNESVEEALARVLGELGDARTKLNLTLSELNSIALNISGVRVEIRMTGKTLASKIASLRDLVDTLGGKLVEKTNAIEERVGAVLEATNYTSERLVSVENRIGSLGSTIHTRIEKLNTTLSVVANEVQRLKAEVEKLDGKLEAMSNEIKALRDTSNTILIAVGILAAVVAAASTISLKK